MKTVVIIGAGAAGLACASTLSRKQKIANIIVLEQFSRSARKLLATGNGRCNLSNRKITMESYNTTDSKIQSLVENFDAVSYFEDIGLVTQYEGDLLYPFSKQAMTVKKTLLVSLQKVTIVEDCKVLQIQQQKGKYDIQTTKQEYQADYVVLATGSKANRISGEDNLDIMKALQMKIIEEHPSLVPLHTQPSFPKVKGVRVKAKVTLFHKEQILDVKEGEVLFTDTGVSGICIMQVSRWVHRYSQPLTLQIDMLPTYTMAEANALLKKRKKQFPTMYLTGMFHEKLANVLEKQAIHPKRMVVDVVGTNDYTRAQVMAGGVALEEVNAHLESHTYANLFIIGEALDVDGDCGGYNLHFAFASGDHVAKYISQKEQGL